MDRDFEIDRIRERLIAGCSAEEFAEMRCPVCNSPLVINVHPNHRVFFVRCAVTAEHIGFHEESVAKPEWWKQCIRGAWY
ncbi:MAG: hypothetical protein K8U03_13210 [Planctomycetia bacterium]|nr:hypothetical protein [Planctomycetia bacterium]